MGWLFIDGKEWGWDGVKDRGWMMGGGGEWVIDNGGSVNNEGIYF